MPGDADVRRYWRLHERWGDTAILMDMTPGDPAAFAAFGRIGAHLHGLGLGTPGVLHRCDGVRMMVLEDLGPDTLATVAARAPVREVDLYAVATDVLLAVQATPPPRGLSVLSPQLGAAMLAPLFAWYVRRSEGSASLEGALAEALETCAGPPDRLSLRDYFSENLIWREGRAGTDRIGILDFQDAFVAPAAYDLASMLRDARRDVSAAATEACLRRFADGTGADLAAVKRAVAVLSVQRNLRILGIFARLARRDGKARYLPMIPRVRAHVLRDVAHPALADLRAPVEAALGGEVMA